MSAKPILTHPRVATTIVAAVLSAFIAIGLLSAVAGLFQRDGTPLAQIVIAERACANYAALRGNPSMLDSGRTNMPLWAHLYR